VADQIVLGKPQFVGYWWDVGYIDLYWLWDFFGGTRTEFTWDGRLTGLFNFERALILKPLLLPARCGCSGTVSDAGC